MTVSNRSTDSHMVIGTWIRASGHSEILPKVAFSLVKITIVQIMTGILAIFEVDIVRKNTNVKQTRLESPYSLLPKLLHRKSIEINGLLTD